MPNMQTNSYVRDDLYQDVTRARELVQKYGLDDPGSRAVGELKHLSGEFQNALYNYYTGNSVGFNEQFAEVVQTSKHIIENALSDIRRGDFNPQGSVESVLSELLSYLQPMQPPPRTVGGGPGSVSDGAIGEMLDKARSAYDPATKADHLGDAINEMLTQLGGGQPTRQPQPDIGLFPGEDPYRPITPAVPAEPELTETKLTGDDLVSRLDAGGKAIGREKDGADDVWGPKGSRNKGEVDPGEELKFHAPERTESATVTIGKLYNDGPDRGRQEQGIIKVFDGDKLVKTIDIRGNASGEQQVEIDVPFSRLEFESAGKGSDFGIKDITVRQSAADGVEGPQPVDGIGEPGAAEGFYANLLGLLGEVGRLIAASDASVGEKNVMIDDLAALTRNAYDWAKSDPEGQNLQAFAKQFLPSFASLWGGMKSSLPENSPESGRILDTITEIVDQMTAALKTQPASGSDDRQSLGETSIG